MTIVEGAQLPARTIPPSAAASRAAARDYSVLGGVLRAPFEFPELPVAAGGIPAWTLSIGTGAPVATELMRLGERQVGSERYHLWQVRGGFRLEYSHAGRFDIATDSGEIVWYPHEGAQMELVRAIVLGPVLALLLEARGLLCLHGSAVEVDGGAVAFLGPKYHGKSTLATALTAAGARLISDDVLAIHPGPPPRLRAGVPSVRLWRDAAERLQVESLCSTVLPGIKTTASGFDGRTYAGTDLPLSGIYLLAPVTADAAEGHPPARRTRLHGVPAAVALAHQTKLPDALIGSRHAGRQLGAAAAIAAAVPVWTLHAVRDLSLLDALVEQVLDWHRSDLRLPDPTRS